VISWFLIIYVATGTYIMMDVLVDSWYWEEYSPFVKITGGFVSVLLWPLIYFIDS
jgi:hypothetical protein